MLLLRILRTILGIAILLVVFTIFQILLPGHAPTDWIELWPYVALNVVMMEIVAGNHNSRAAVEQLLAIYQTNSLPDPTAKHEILSAILELARGEPLHRDVAIVRRVVDLALRGDAIAMEALGEKVRPKTLHRAIRSDSLYDRAWGNRCRLWQQLLRKANAGQGMENACKLASFGLGLRSIVHLSAPLEGRERESCSKLHQDYAPQGALGCGLHSVSWHSSSRASCSSWSWCETCGQTSTSQHNEHGRAQTKDRQRRTPPPRKGDGGVGVSERILVDKTPKLR